MFVSLNDPEDRDQCIRNIKTVVINYICSNLLLNSEMVVNNDGLISGGNIDPDFLLYLIPFIESYYQITFGDREINQTMFDSIETIAGAVYLKCRLNALGSQAKAAVTSR